MRFWMRCLADLAMCRRDYRGRRLSRIARFVKASTGRWSPFGCYLGVLLDMVMGNSMSSQVGHRSSIRFGGNVADRD